MIQLAKLISCMFSKLYEITIPYFCMIWHHNSSLTPTSFFILRSRRIWPLTDTFSDHCIVTRRRVLVARGRSIAKLCFYWTISVIMIVELRTKCLIWPWSIFIVIVIRGWGSHPRSRKHLVSLWSRLIFTYVIVSSSETIRTILSISV